MPPLRLAQDYLVWHYTAGPVDLSLLAFRFLRFFRRFFALSLQPRRPLPPAARSPLPSQILKGLMSFLSFLLRSFLSLFGFVILAVVALLWPVALALWLIAPFLVIVFWFVGFYLLLHL